MPFRPMTSNREMAPWMWEVCRMAMDYISDPSVENENNYFNISASESVNRGFVKVL